MLRIAGNQIYLTRGDTATIQVNIRKKNRQPYKMEDGDKAVFSVKKTTKDSELVFQKPVGKDGMVVIRPEDTEGLPYGSYVYDCQLTLATGVVDTIIAPQLFKLTEEVTY